MFMLSELRRLVSAADPAGLGSVLHRFRGLIGCSVRTMMSAGSEQLKRRSFYETSNEKQKYNVSGTHLLKEQRLSVRDILVHMSNICSRHK